MPSCFESVHVSHSVPTCFQERLLFHICCSSMPLSLPEGCQMEQPRLFGTTPVPQSSLSIFVFWVLSTSSVRSTAYLSTWVVLHCCRSSNKTLLSSQTQRGVLEHLAHLSLADAMDFMDSFLGIGNSEQKGLEAFSSVAEILLTCHWLRIASPFVHSVEFCIEVDILFLLTCNLLK